MDRWGTRGRGVQDHSVLLRYYGSRPPYTALQLACQPELFSEAHWGFAASSPYAVIPSFPLILLQAALKGLLVGSCRKMGLHAWQDLWLLYILWSEPRCILIRTIYLSHLFLSLMGLNQCSNRCPLCRRLCEFLGESMEEQNCPPRSSKPLWAEKTLLNVCRNGTMSAPRLACKAIVLIDNAIADLLTPATLS